MKNDLKKILINLKKLKLINKSKSKKTGFLIGNTSKNNNKKFYLTPIRNFKNIVICGVIIYSEKEALEISKIVDGNVDFLFIDSEKKIQSDKLHYGKISNLERAVRENVKKSFIISYKGNDLTVDATDLLLSSLTNNFLRGLGGKRALIIGAGNLGSKVALKLIERGSDVYLYRRNLKALKSITNALNLIKPIHTKQYIKHLNNLSSIPKNIDIIIGATNGVAVINKKMLINSNSDLILLDVGKGTIKKDAINYANRNNIKIYRLDVTAALAGMVEKNLYFYNYLNKTTGAKVINNLKIISGGIFGQNNDIVVDNVFKPKRIFGLADGKGDLKQKLNIEEKNIIKKISKILTIK